MKTDWIERKVTYSAKKHLRSYKGAFNGIIIALRYELNFQIELFLMVLVLIAGFIFPITKTEWIVIILCIGITLSVELMNTSIETLGEFKRFHAIIKKIKDLSAGAVLVITIMDVIIAFMIFFPYILEYLPQ